MYLRTSQKKLVDGSIIERYQLAEGVWERGKKRSRTNIVYYFGRTDDPAVVDKLRKLVRSIFRRFEPEQLLAEVPGWRVVEAWPYGDLYVLEALWKRLNLDAIIEKHAGKRRLGFSLERAIFAMVANHALAPYSKLYCYERWLRDDVRISGTDGLEIQHFYRAMDFLEANKEELEKSIFLALAEVFNLEVDLVFSHTRSLDVPQGGVVLAVTREGLPVRHWVFSGKTVNVTTIKQVKEDLRSWKLSGCVFVGNAGMVSTKNLRTLAPAGDKYIVCLPFHQGEEVTELVTNHTGRYRPVANSLRVKEVVVGKGKQRQHYVVCHNPLEEQRQRRQREKVLAELEAELIALGELDSKEYAKRASELVASSRYGQYIRQIKAGKLRIDRTAVSRAEKNEGKFIVQSNDETLTPEDLALGCSQSMQVEQTWRTLKRGLRMHPEYHWAPHRIQAHIFLSVLSLLLKRVAEQGCADTWGNIRDDLKQIKLAQLSGPRGTVWQTTKPRSEARNRLKSLKIDRPPMILDHI